MIASYFKIMQLLPRAAVDTNYDCIVEHLQLTEESSAKAN